MNRVSLLRRVNLGNYEHWELFVEIEDVDENRALMKAMVLINKGLSSLDQPTVDTKKIEVA